MNADEIFNDAFGAEDRLSFIARTRRPTEEETAAARASYRRAALLRRIPDHERAQEVVFITPDEARALPGMIGRLAGPTLREKGWYGCTRDGVRTLFIDPEAG
jgi:hypothetical protein